MGDGADMAMEQGFDEWEASLGGPDEEDFFEEPDYRILKKQDKSAKRTFNYDKIVVETPKAWRLGLSNGQEFWVPKSQCSLFLTQKQLSVPQWLWEQIPPLSSQVFVFSPS